MKGVTYCVSPPEDRQDDVLHHFWWREGVEAPVVHRRQAQGGTEAQLQARDPLRGGHGALAGVELHAHHPQVRGQRLHPLDERLQCVGHYQQVIDVGLDEALLGPSRRAQAVPLRPEQGLQEGRVQQGALGVALPDAAQHVGGLR